MPEYTPPAQRARDGEPWVVWSYEHSAWWGAAHCGYYTDLLLAGLYTEAEAKEIERSANRGRIRNEEALSLREAIAELLAEWAAARGAPTQRVAGRVLSLMDEVAAQREIVRELRLAGATLSNFAFNLEQRPTLDERAIALLRESRMAWDRTVLCSRRDPITEPNRNAPATPPENTKGDPSEGVAQAETQQ